MSPEEKQAFYWGVSGSAVSGFIIGVGFFVATRLVLNFPNRALAPGKAILAWMAGYMLAGGLTFGVTFAIVVRRKPSLMRYGIYLVQIITVLLILLVLIARIIFGVAQNK